MLQQFRREPAEVKHLAAEALILCAKHKITYYEVWARMLYAWAEATQGGGGEHLSTIQRSIDQFRDTESGVRLPYYVSLLADACLRVGQLEQGLAALSDAERIVNHNGEYWWMAELHRLRGELLQRQGGAPTNVESCFDESIALARQQSAKLLELRSTVSLAQLWQRQGKLGEARQRLTELLDSFTEGWDTPDLQEAQTLLRHLH
jgi:predicted ATPase